MLVLDQLLGAGAATALDAAIGGSPTGVAVLDRELRLVYLNDAGAVLSSLRPADVGQPIQVTHPEISERSLQALQGVLSTGVPLRMVGAVGPGDEPLLANVSAVRDGAGSIVGACSVFVDLTAERAVQQRALEWAELVASSEDAIFTKSLDGVILSWNGAAERLYGYAADEAIGRPVTMLAPPDRHAEITQLLGVIAGGGRVDHYETVRRRHDGRLLDVSLTLSPVYWRDGSLMSVSVIARDVSQQRAAERALRESEQHRRAILSSLLRSEESERSRIATELHDDTVQVMTASLFALDRVVTAARNRGYSDLEPSIALARATLEEATERTRRLMFELRPAILHEEGIAAAVRVIGDQTARECDAEVHIDIPPGPLHARARGAGLPHGARGALERAQACPCARRAGQPADAVRPPAPAGGGRRPGLRPL